MDRSRRIWMQAIAAGAVSTAFPDGRAELYPSRPIKIIVPSTPGGIVDVEVRRIAPRLADALGQPVVVDNRPGANNTIGMTLLAKAPPDGYTIGYGSTTPFSAAAAMMPKLPYDPVKDFEPITLKTAITPLRSASNEALVAARAS